MTKEEIEFEQWRERYERALLDVRPLLALVIDGMAQGESDLQIFFTLTNYAENYARQKNLRLREQTIVLAIRLAKLGIKEL